MIAPGALLAIAVLLAVAVACSVAARRPATPAPDGAADLRRPIENTAHKFGETGTYYRAEIVDGAGNRRVVLWTHAQIMEGVRRARRNPEDVA